MTLKEEENQLVWQLNLRIGVNVAVYFVLVIFIAYRLYQTSLIKSMPSVGNVVVPNLKLENFSSLSEALKATGSGSVLPSVSRVEPFD